MKNTAFLIIAMILMAGEIFAGSVVTNRNVKALSFIKGSSTLNLSGQMNDAAMQSISKGNEIAVYNYLDSYLVFPTLFPRTKAGFGTKTATRNVSVNAKNGKFNWTEKDVTPYFAFATGNEKIRPSKAVFKSKGTLQTSELAELENKRFTVFDMLCSEQGLGYLASLALIPEIKGKNYKFSYNDGKFQVKGSIDPKGKVTAKYAIPFPIAYPVFLESEDFFTNKYDYSLVIVGEGEVKSGYYEPDKVEFRVTKNKDKFRYFFYNGTKVTNDFMKLELEADTDVTAVFGTYDFSLNVVGDGAVSAEFTGPDEVELKVTDGSELFFYYDVNGEKFTDSNMTLSLQGDTVVEAYFKDDYIVVDLSGGPNAKSYPVTHIYAVPEGGWTEEYKTTKLVLRKIKPGTFTMGSPKNELGRDDNETQHQVTLTNAYYIGVFEVTQKQYQLITGIYPAYYEGNARPVETVSYNVLRGSDKGATWPVSYDVDETSFFGKLRTKTQMTFDLPTEAQWEYACRAGTTTALNSGKNLSDEKHCGEMAEVGRYFFNQNVGEGGYKNHTTVGSYLQNAWGLYDMHGNVWEWCLDWYQSDLGSDQATEPLGTSWGADRVLRGGSWYDDAYRCRSAVRVYNKPDAGSTNYGFRVALVQNVFSGPDNQIQKDFEFEIESGTENTLPIFQTKFYGKLKNGTEKLLEEMGRLEYDGASGIVSGFGKHKLTWIPDAAFTNIMDEVELRVEYEDVTEQANYLVLDTTSNKMRVSPDAPNTTDDKCRTDELWLRRIEPGTFTMGSPKNELGRDDSETQHEVTLTKAYYIGVFEMTQKQCYNIMGVNPSSHIGDLRPVESVSYDMLRGTKDGSAWPKNNGVDENSFMGQLRKKAGNIFDLPTEAQWEFACRAGTTTALNNGTNLTNVYEDGNMNKLGRYYYNYTDWKGGYKYNYNHTKVGSYLPNAWGLYDMHGNVNEWCLDWYKSYRGNATDPKGANSGSSRVLRGGGWGDGADGCRSAGRNGNAPDDGNKLYGFRVTLVPGPDNQIQKDFEFEIESGTENTLPIFQTKFYGKLKNGTEKLLEEMGRLEYDGASGIVAGIGKHKLTWIPDAAYTNIMNEVELRIEYEDVTEQATYLVLNTTSNKMLVSSEGPDIADDKCRMEELWLRRIEPGTFAMGSPENEIGRGDNEIKHTVVIKRAYYIGVFETTQKQYELISGNNPSKFKGDMRPVESVSYDLLRGEYDGSMWPEDYGVDEGSFMGQLRKKAGNIFDLPTEAQWEYACRAGKSTALNSGKNLTDKTKCSNMDEVGRYVYNKNDGKGVYSEHTVVGSYLPNAWGLYDMHGNVWEWCLDWYSAFATSKGATNGTSRVLRGGDFNSPAYVCRSAERFNNKPYAGNNNYGFRVALVQNVFSESGNQIQKDFEYEIISESNNILPVFEVKFYGIMPNGKEYLLEEIGKIECDGASGIVMRKGKHKLTWIPDSAYTNIMDEVELRVEYEDVTEQANYLVLDLSSNKMRVSTEGPDTTNDKCRTDELWLRRIVPGQFSMGSPPRELGSYDNETWHRVTLTKAYYIGIFETTQKHFELITGNNPSALKGDARPVETVSYDILRGDSWPYTDEVDEDSFFGILRSKTQMIFDLPTEAQWEYACRAGKSTALNSGKNLTDKTKCSNMDEVGRYLYNKNDGKGVYSEHTIVGSYLPNAWGLYDMHGNVWEWCLDWYQADLGTLSETDPAGAKSGDERVLRGGAWNGTASRCRSAIRSNANPVTRKSDKYGFRVVLVQ